MTSHLIAKRSIVEATISDTAAAAQIHKVAQAAYTFEAGLIKCAEFPPLLESVPDLQASSDTFLVLVKDDAIVGALSYAREQESVVITRLVVSPAYFRQGIATALLMELERRVSADVTITVSTGAWNIPGVLLYRKCGYTTSHTTPIAEGISLLHLRKSLTSRPSD